MRIFLLDSLLIIKRIVLFFIFLSASFINKVSAQQDAMFTQYLFNSMAINPAYAGSREAVSLTAQYRNQWVGMDGAPKTFVFSADMPVFENKVGLGVQAFVDEIGVSKSSGFYFSYAYRLHFGETSSLAFGLQGGLTNYKANVNSIQLTDANDPRFATNISSFLPAFGAGVYYNTDKFYAGLSAPNLVKSFLRRDEFLYYTDVIAKRFSHLFLSAGYVFDVNEESNIKLKPSFLVKYVKGAPIQADFTTQVWLKDVVSLGASYRTDRSGAFLLEVQATPALKIGYFYDVSNKALKAYNRGSHEIMLHYEFNLDIDRILSPRYF